MSAPKDLIETLERSNRRWKMIALAACMALVLVGIIGYVGMLQRQAQVERALRDVTQARVEALEAANSLLSR